MLIDAGWGKGVARRIGALLDRLLDEGIGPPDIDIEKDKRKLLAMAVSQGALVFGSHLPFPAIGRVTSEREAWRWRPLLLATNLIP